MEKRFVLAGTDYVYPRTTNKILEAYLISKVLKEDIMINYTPFGHSDWQSIVSDIKNLVQLELKQQLFQQSMEMQIFHFIKS